MPRRTPDMNHILQELPFFRTETTAHVGAESVVIRAYQIIVWVSLSPPTVLQLSPDTPRFPAVLDTGHNHNLSMQEEHLHGWAGVEAGSLTRRGEVRVGPYVLPLLTANVWLHRNKRGERDIFSRRPPFCLELAEGIAIYPRGMPTVARLPILGLRPLVGNNLHLSVDGTRCRVSLRSPGT